jgi:hypothetical protein
MNIILAAIFAAAVIVAIYCLVVSFWFLAGGIGFVICVFFEYLRVMCGGK